LPSAGGASAITHKPLAFAAPSRVDDTVIGHIEAVLWRCMRQDDALGPQAALDTTLAQRNLVRGLLPPARPTATRPAAVSVCQSVALRRLFVRERVFA